MLLYGNTLYDVNETDFSEFIMGEKDVKIIKKVYEKEFWIRMEKGARFCRTLG